MRHGISQLAGFATVCKNIISDFVREIKAGLFIFK